MKKSTMIFILLMPVATIFLGTLLIGMWYNSDFDIYFKLIHLISAFGTCVLTWLFLGTKLFIEIKWSSEK